jgi:hypothetical protein
MYNKCKCILLPTDKLSKIGLYHNKLFDSDFGSKTDNWFNQHLYILSDDEIKEGDWMFHILDNKPVRYDGISGSGFPYGYKKIIASTDSSLTFLFNNPQKISNRIYKSLPSIPQLFIDKYVSENNKGNKIEEVMVEYEEVFIQNKIGFGKVLEGIKLKLNPDNTINIKSVEPINWTRDQIIKFGQDCMVIGVKSQREGFDMNERFLDFVIESNL